MESAGSGSSDSMPAASTKSAEQARDKSRAREYTEVIGLTILAALFLKVFVVEAYNIPTASMENTLLAGDFVLVNKFVYGARSPRYIPFTNISIPQITLPAISHPKTGDVVVFEFPGNPDEYVGGTTENYVKRCIAGPGDTVMIADKAVFVNGRQVQLPTNARFENVPLFPKGFKDYRIFPRGSTFNEDNYGPVVVPKRGADIRIATGDVDEYRDLIEREGHSVAMGDGGNILIDGAASHTYQVMKDYYFMMGDNRDNSLDSRFWGFVSDDRIIGKAIVVYWSWDVSNAESSFGQRLSTIRWNRMGTIVR